MKNKMNAKGIEKILFELEAPVIIFPNGNKNTKYEDIIPEWLLARIKFERLNRNPNEVLATPSELVTYLMTAMQNTSINSKLYDMYLRYYENIVESIDKCEPQHTIKLSGREEKLVNDLREWIYSQQIEYFNNKYIK